jgi:hypothetical protein
MRRASNQTNAAFLFWDCDAHSSERNIRSAPSIDLIARALEFDPSRRPNNAREFTVQIAADLERRL